MEQLKSLIIREAPEQHKETFEKILSDIQAYQEQLDYWEKAELSHKQVIYPLFYELKNGLNIPGIEHGYLLIGGYYAGEELIQSVFQISDEKGKIYAAKDELIRILTSSLTDDNLIEESPDNVAGIIKDVDEYLFQEHADKCKILISQNDERIENWTNLRKEEFILSIKDSSEIDDLRIGRGLRLPFGEITHIEEIDTLDIVAHDHYREIIDDIKDNPVFKKRNLDDEDIPETEAVRVEAVVQDQQISIFDDVFKATNVKSFQNIDTNKDIDNLYEAYQKAYVKKAAPKKKDSKPDGQITIFDLFGDTADTSSVDTRSKEEQAPTDKTVSQDNLDITIEIAGPSKSNVPELYVKELFKQKVEEFKRVAISVPKISISYSSSIEFKPFTVKRNVMDFDVAASKIERYDAVNNRLLQTLDADPLMVDDPENTLACSLLETIPEFSYDDADLILDVVEQYLRLIDGDEETKRKIIRRYATVIVEDLRQQIYASKEEHTEFIYNVQQDLIVFGSFAKTKLKHVDGKLGYKKEIADKKNIKNYLFEGYRKSYYPVNSFDSDDERRFAVVLEDDEGVVRFIKPPLNQLGLFYRAGKQYNPDFLVETKDCKYMVEVKAANQVNNEDVQEKARAGVKWCECASKVDADDKKWKYRLVSGEDIIIGNTLKYILGLAVCIYREVLRPTPRIVEEEFLVVSVII